LSLDTTLSDLRPRLQRTYNLAKRMQRRAYAADRYDAELRQHWASPQTQGPYSEEVFSVAPDPDRVRSVLVFKPDEIGDAVYALPAVAELRRIYPQASIHLLCQRLTEPVYSRSGLFDEIVAVAPDSRLARPHLPLQEALSDFSLPRFDVSVFLRTYSAYFRQFRSIPAGVRVHPVDPHMRSDSVNRADVSLWTPDRRHQVLQMLEIVGRLSGRSYSFADVSFPEFDWSDEDRQATELVFGDSQPGPYVVIHPFAKGETRQYPLEHWSALLARVRERFEARWVVVGGPADPVLQDAPGVVQTQGRLSLSQTGYLMSRASAFAGILSGPAHWAAALGTPTLTIMSGHSLPREWAPLGQSRVLRADVPCAPCHQPTCPIYGLACLTALTPGRVLPRLEDFLRSALECA
jgi:ADP-heptose:LPS heptosyltransferase